VGYIFATDQALICKRLTKWTINKQGYDTLKSYWGVGVPVWTYDLYFLKSNNKFHADTAIRAKTKREAKAKIKAMYPGVKRFVD
jgi:hypothetical protein